MRISRLCELNQSYDVSTGEQLLHGLDLQHAQHQNHHYLDYAVSEVVVQFADQTLPVFVLNHRLHRHVSVFVGHVVAEDLQPSSVVSHVVYRQFVDRVSMLEHDADVQSDEFMLGGVDEPYEVAAVIVAQVGAEIFEVECLLVDYAVVVFVDDD